LQRAYQQRALRRLSQEAHRGGLVWPEWAARWVEQNVEVKVEDMLRLRDH
jgi:hypothetical protein